MRDTIAQTRFENVSTHSNDSLLARDKEKPSSTNEIVSLKRRVKKLEKRNRSRTHGLKRLYKVGLTARVESFGDEENLGEDASKQGRRINAIDADEDITLVNDDADKEMFDVDALNGEKVFVARQNENVVEESLCCLPVSIASITVTNSTLKKLLWLKLWLTLRAQQSQAKILLSESTELKQESTKKQKVDEDKDTSKLQSLMEVIPDEEEVAIDVVPLATESNVSASLENFNEIIIKVFKTAETTKFVRDFKSLAKEDDESLEKIKNGCKVPGNLKGKSSDTQYVTKSLDALSQKLDDENVSLEWQTTVVKPKLKTDSLQKKLKIIISENVNYHDPQWETSWIAWFISLRAFGTRSVLGLGRFIDSDLEVAFRRNTGFVRNLDGVDMLKRNHSTNLYIINLHKMAHASPNCPHGSCYSTTQVMLYGHQSLSHLQI
ncbi:hypothetical protein Tco_1531593 [Tanacetum coccineum]